MIALFSLAACTTVLGHPFLLPNIFLPALTFPSYSNIVTQIAYYTRPLIHSIKGKIEIAKKKVKFVLHVAAQVRIVFLK